MVTVDSAAISPIALNVQISGSYIKELDLAPRNPEEGEAIRITAITLKDGTVLTQEDAYAWGSSIRDKVCVLNMQMQKLMDVDQIKSITPNDTEFKLAE